MEAGCQWDQGSKGVRVPRASAARLRHKYFSSPANVIFICFPIFIQEFLFYDIILYGSRATEYVMPVFFSRIQQEARMHSCRYRQLSSVCFLELLPYLLGFRRCGDVFISFKNELCHNLPDIRTLRYSSTYYSRWFIISVPVEQSIGFYHSDSKAEAALRFMHRPAPASYIVPMQASPSEGCDADDYSGVITKI